MVATPLTCPENDGLDLLATVKARLYDVCAAEQDMARVVLGVEHHAALFVCQARVGNRRLGHGDTLACRLKASVSTSMDYKILQLLILKHC